MSGLPPGVEVDSTRVRFRTEDGLTLDGRWHHPDTPHVGVAVVCHPHPRMGGSMRSWLVPVLARALAATGWRALRFDFRGVGASEGSSGGGTEEVLDVAAAVSEALRAIDPGMPLLVGGWSFGALTSLRYVVGDDGPRADRVDAWFGVALPAATGGLLPAVPAESMRTFDRPLLLVHGDADALTPLAPVERLAGDVSTAELVVIEGADHFFGRQAGDVAQAVTEFASRLLP